MQLYYGANREDPSQGAHPRSPQNCEKFLATSVSLTCEIKHPMNKSEIAFKKLFSKYPLLFLVGSHVSEGKWTTATRLHD